MGKEYEMKAVDLLKSMDRISEIMIERRCSFTKAKSVAKQEAIDAFAAIKPKPPVPVQSEPKKADTKSSTGSNDHLVCLSFRVEEVIERHDGGGVVFYDTTLKNYITGEIITLRGRHWPAGSKVDFRETVIPPTLA
jgi:hypothetical protein